MQTLHHGPALLFRRLGQHLAYFPVCRRRHAHEQRTRPDGRNDIRRRVREQDKSQIGRVFLHRPTQGGLGVSREVVGLVYHHHLEPLPRRQVHLLRLRDLLEEVLYHDSVIGSYVGGGYFEVVDGSDDVEFELAVRCGLENSRVDLDLFDAGSVEFF